MNQGDQIKPRWTTAVYLVSYDRTQELGLTLLGRVPMLALYPHTSLVYSYYHNIHIYSLCLHTSFLRQYYIIIYYVSDYSTYFQLLFI